MAYKQHNPADDFDLMLRQHLKRGGAPVAPCVGFDADTANAYVEGALSASPQLQFEKHLAGCAACRRHVVALARLSEVLAATPVVMPVAPAQIAGPFWTRWQNTLAQWFDFSAWNPAWTAATGTACALLFAALGAGVWWRAQAPQANQAAVTLSQPTNLEVLSGGTLNDTASVAAVEAGSTKPLVSEVEAALTSQPGAPVTEAVVLAPPPIPRPSATPTFPLTNGLVALTTSTPELRTLAIEPSAPTIAPSSVPPPAFNLPATAISFNQPANSLSAPVRLGGTLTPSEVRLLPGEPETKELVSELLLPKPRRPQIAEESRAKTVNEAGKSTGNRELLKALKGRTFGFMPMRDSDNDAKDIDARTKEANLKEAQEQTKPLMKRLNGHVFYFDHGFWIDEAYTSDSKLPIKRMTRGSQEYQQIVIQNPSLEQFFQLGQVIVVWKGIVYEVRK